MPNGKPVVVTTESRGVYFGYADDTSGDVITLTNARNCIYWSAETGGFMGLACTGPAKGSKIGARIKTIELRKITTIMPAEPEAVAAWEVAGVHGK